MRTHFSEVFDAWAMQVYTHGASAPAGTVFCGLPLFHVNGQLVTGLSPWSRGCHHLVIGTPQGYRDKGVLERFWAIVEHYRINAFSGVPTVYATLLQTPLGSHDVSSVESGYCGAAPMPTELFRSFEAKTGNSNSRSLWSDRRRLRLQRHPPPQPRIGSVGLRLPYQDMAVMILDETGVFLRLAEVDEPGVLAIKGPNVFSGYVNPIHNAGLWIDCGGERWLNTGDLARQDADGYFWLTGRKKELIIRGGHNIDPKLVEEPLHRHPAVALAAAIGRPDSRAGETPVLYVQLKAGATASETELLEYARAHILERAAHPKTVKIVQTMPVTAVGKIFKPALSMMEIADVVRAEAAANATQLTSVDVMQDAKRGLVARVGILGDSGAFRSAIGAYAFTTEIV